LFKYGEITDWFTDQLLAGMASSYAPKSSKLYLMNSFNLSNACLRVVAQYLFSEFPQVSNLAT
jgi:hypothetical protein